MKKTAFMLVVTLVAIVGFTAANLFSAEDKEEKKEIKYSGNKQCIMCHKGIDDSVSVWTESKHAKAFESLASDEAKKFSKDPQNAPVCLGCHTTGYGKEGGYASDLEDKKKEPVIGITCESCHGPGTDYNKVMMKAKDGLDVEAATAAGLTLKPTKETCLGCHNDKSPMFNKDEEFDFDKMFEKIKHGKKLEKSE